MNTMVRAITADPKTRAAIGRAVANEPITAPIEHRREA